MKKAFLSILSIILLNLLIISEAQCAFTRDDWDTFRASALTGDISLEVLRNLQSRPPSYFRANPPTQWLAQNTDEEVRLESYLAILNGAAAFSGVTSTLTFRTTGLSTNGSGQYIFSSLSQLLSSLVGYTGSSSVPASIEALPTVQSLLSTINTRFITQQTEDGLFSTFGLQVTSPVADSLPTVASIPDSSSISAVDQGVNLVPYLDYIKSLIHSHTAIFTIPGYQNFKALRVDYPTLSSIAINQLYSFEVLLSALRSQDGSVSTPPNMVSNILSADSGYVNSFIFNSSQRFNNFRLFFSGPLGSLTISRCLILFEETLPQNPVSFRAYLTTYRGWSVVFTNGVQCAYFSTYDHVNPLGEIKTP